MQRLFSTFADGWPGAGLLLQRILAGTLVVYFGIINVVQNEKTGLSVLYVIAAVAGIFMLLGLWTPVAGIAIAITEVCILSARVGSLLPEITLAGLAVTVAMIGPGMWSIDARLYGRKLLADPRH